MMDLLRKINVCMSQTNSNGLMDPLTKLFECSICETFFKTPMQLKCGHIFCKECLKKGIKNLSNISCPTCKCKTIKRTIQERNDIKELTSSICQILRSFSEENKNIRNGEANQIIPLDLSLKKQQEFSNRNPNRSGSAIKFIKPLDLTCNQKNKCDAMGYKKLPSYRTESKEPCKNNNSISQDHFHSVFGHSNGKLKDITVPYAGRCNDETIFEDNDHAKTIGAPHVNKCNGGLVSEQDNAEAPTIRRPYNEEVIAKSSKKPDSEISTGLSATSNDFGSDFDLLLKECPLISQPVALAVETTLNRNLSMEVAEKDITSPVKRNPMKNFYIGKRILSLDDMTEDNPHTKIPKTDNLMDEKAKQIDFMNRNANQTEETYYSEVNNEIEDDDMEMSDSEVSVLAETPVKEIDSKRKSLRDIHSVVTKRCIDVKESESSVESEVMELPVLPSTISYVNRQNECSEIPSGMFEMSFDKLEEAQQSGGKKVYSASPPNEIQSGISSSPSLLSSRFVFCPTRLNKPKLLQLQKLCDICNGRIVKLYEEEVTHLVIDLERGRVPQTMKYLFAIAGKKWVVTFDWVYKCLQEGRMVDEEPFETSNSPECDIGVRKSRLASSPLFKEFNFFIGSNMKSSGATVEECKKLLTQLGGNIIVSPGEVSENVMIIGDLLDKSRTYEYWYNSKGWLTVCWEWILDCILTFSLVNFEKKHLITNLNGCGLSKANLPKALLDVRQVQ